LLPCEPLAKSPPSDDPFGLPSFLLVVRGEGNGL